MADGNGVPADNNKKEDEDWLDGDTVPSSTPTEDQGNSETGPATDADIAAWNPDWTIDSPRSPNPDAAKFSSKFDNGGKVLVLAPFSKTKPSTLSRRLVLPADRPMQLSVRVGTKQDSHADWILKAFANDTPLSEPLVISSHDGERKYDQVTWDLSAWKGKS